MKSMCVLKGLKIQLAFQVRAVFSVVIKEKLNSGLFIGSVVRNLLEAGRSMYFTIKTEL